jgi:hypothetical protein
MNAALAFFLELAMLAGFGYWGFHLEKSAWVKWGVGLGLPILLAVLWGIFFAPRAGQRLDINWGLGLSLILFLLAALALYQSNRPALAIALALTAITNRGIAFIWHQW